jgi:hypothetical protein
VNEGHRDFFLSTFSLTADGARVMLSRASSSYAKDGQHEASKAMDADPQSGWSVDGGQGRRHVAVFHLAVPLASPQELVVRMLFEKHYAAGLGRFRLWATTDTGGAEASALPDDLLAVLARSPETWSEPERTRLLSYYCQVAPELSAEREPIEKLQRERPSHPTTLVMRERPADNPRATFVRHRGEFLQPRDRVEAGFPRSAGLSPDVPGTGWGLHGGWFRLRTRSPRVTVNREWAAFFGRGLVGTPGLWLSR